MANEYISSDDSIDLAEVIRKLWDRKKFIISTTLLSSMLITVISFNLPTTFETTVRLQPPTDADIRALNHLSPSPALMASLNPETELAKRLSPLVTKDFGADDVFNRFISNIASRKLQVKALDEVDADNFSPAHSNNSALNKNQAYEALLSGLSIQLARSDNQTSRYASDSDTVISFRHNDPLFASEFLNFLVDLAILQTKADLKQQATHIAQSRLAIIKSDIEQLRTQFIQQTQNNITQIEEKNIIAKKKIENRILALQRKYQYDQKSRGTQLEESAAIARSLNIAKPVSLQNSHANLERALYLMGYEILEAEIKALKDRSNDDHYIPEITQLKYELELLEADPELKILQSRTSPDPYIPNLPLLKAHANKLKSFDRIIWDIEPVRIQQSAWPPSSPIKPKRLLIIVAGIILSFLLSAMLTLIIPAIKAPRNT